MKQTLLSAAILCALLSNPVQLAAQTKDQQPVKSKTMETTNKKQSKEAVQGFFNAFGKGDFEGILNSFHENATIIGIRDAQRSGAQIYGSYKGKEGVKAFVSNLGNAFETKAFSVENVIGEGNIAFANGTFTHIVKATGKSFSSDWSLMCVIKDDKIFEYHFYEDSEKFAEASRN